MGELKLYSVTDDYISFLQSMYSNVYSNKQESRTHTRKYIGVAFRSGKYNYYVPLSSPKRSDYQFAGGKLVIKKSIVPIIRIVVKNARRERELKGTLRISHMIPVPVSEFIKYDLDNEKDIKYKELVSDEMIYIRKNRHRIIQNAEEVYHQKIHQDESAKYIKTALDFEWLEILCDMFVKKKTRCQQRLSYYFRNYKRICVCEAYS